VSGVTVSFAVPGLRAWSREHRSPASKAVLELRPGSTVGGGGGRRHRTSFAADCEMGREMGFGGFGGGGGDDPFSRSHDDEMKATIGRMFGAVEGAAETDDGTGAAPSLTASALAAMRLSGTVASEREGERDAAALWWTDGVFVDDKM
jgi:hypothetical protein